MNERSAGTISKRQITALLAVALVLSGGGLGIGAYSLVIGGQQGPAGPQGLQGDQGTQGSQGDQGPIGPAGMVGPVVGILDPDNNTVVSGNVTVRIMLWNSTPCTFEVLVNGSLNTTALPWQWDTTKLADGWWNLTVCATNATAYSQQDSVNVYTYNTQWLVTNNTKDAPHSVVAVLGTWMEFHNINFQLPFTANLFVSYEAVLYFSAGDSFIEGAWELDGVMRQLGLAEYEITTSHVRFWFQCQFNHVSQGAHKISFWFLAESGMPTLNAEFNSRLIVQLTPS